MQKNIYRYLSWCSFLNKVYILKMYLNLLTVIVQKFKSISQIASPLIPLREVRSEIKDGAEKVNSPFANSLDHKCLQYFVKGWMRKKWQFSICLANSLNHVFEIHLYLDTVPNLGNLLCKGRQQKRTAAGGFLDQNDHFKMKNRKNLGSPHLVLYRFSRCFSYRFLFRFYAVC